MRSSPVAPLGLCAWLGLVACGTQYDTLRSNYPSGRLHTELATRGGEAHGVYRELYPDGRLRADGGYRDGKRHGLWEIYGTDGILLERIAYRDGEVTWRGDRHEIVPDDVVLLDIPDADRDEAAEPVALDEIAGVVSDFAGTDRLARVHRVSLQASTQILETAEDVGSLHRLELSGSVVVAGWPIYLDLMSSHLHQTNGGLDLESKHTLELGAGQVLDLERGGPGRPRLELVARGGLVIPTDHDDRDGAAVCALSIHERLTDQVACLPNTVPLRLAGSLLGRQRYLAFRLDGGLDLAFAHRADPTAMPLDDFATIGRLDAGVGVDNAWVAATIDLTTSAFLVGRRPELLRDGFYLPGSAATVAFRLRRQAVRPFVGGSLILEPDLIGRRVAFFGGLEWVDESPAR